MLAICKAVTVDNQQLKQQVEQGSIEKAVITKMPESGGFWFMYFLDRQTQGFDILTTEQGCALAFDTLDDAIHMLCESGFDGNVDVLWDKEGVTCN